MQLPAGSGGRIPHQHPALLGRERPLGRRGDQYHHQARYEPVPRLGARPLPRHRPGHGRKGSRRKRRNVQLASRLHPPAVRRLHWRTGQERHGLPVLRPQPRARTPEPAGRNRPPTTNWWRRSHSFGDLDKPAATIPRPFFETRYNGRADWTFSNKDSAYLSYTSQANNSLNDQSDGTGDLNNGNFTVNHLQLANLTLNSVLSDTTVNTATFGYQYWNNLIASKISSPLVTFNGWRNRSAPTPTFRSSRSSASGSSETTSPRQLASTPSKAAWTTSGTRWKAASSSSAPHWRSTSPRSQRHYCQYRATYPDGFSHRRRRHRDVHCQRRSLLPGCHQAAWLVLPGRLEDDPPPYLEPWPALGQGLQHDRRIRQSRTAAPIWICASSTVPISNPYVNSIAKDDNLDFSPRVGFAYDLTGKGNHVLRGGYGLYYGNVFQNIPLFMEQMANPTVFQTVLSLSDPPTDIVPGTGNTLGQLALWHRRHAYHSAALRPSLAFRSVGRLMDPNYRNPVTEEFNLGYTWAVNQNTAVEAEYTHVLGLHGNRTINVDQRIPVDGACCTRPLDAALRSIVHCRSRSRPVFVSNRRSAVSTMTASTSASAIACGIAVATCTRTIPWPGPMAMGPAAVRSATTPSWQQHRLRAGSGVRHPTMSATTLPWPVSSICPRVLRSRRFCSMARRDLLT